MNGAGDSPSGIGDPAFVSQRTARRWLAVIGLETHVQLKTRTKLFCGCEYRFGAEPNTLCCAVCTAQPGALPVLNREALALAVRAGLALGAQIAPLSKFDRKHYFYCDLPKGYQVSQYDEPYCKGGGIQLDSGRFIRLERIHIEEDAGKAIHDRGTSTLVDLNRAGVPLIEMVTQADIQTSAEAFEYLTKLKERLQYAGVSDCDMEKGSLRCDVNISVRPAGEPWRTKVEIKNLNSFRFIAAAIEHEAWRQIEAYESEDPRLYPVQETRLYDPDRNQTRTMRGKESARDYRYFPDPDLPPIAIDSAFLERERASLSEPADSRRARYRAQLGLSPADAAALTSERAVSDYFEACLRAGLDARETASWIQNELIGWVGDGELGLADFSQLPISPRELGEVLALIRAGTIASNAGRKLLRARARVGPDGAGIAALVRELGLEQVQDDSQLEQWCREALVGKDKIIADYRSGKDAALNALLGPVMKASGGRAAADKVREILKRLLAP